MKAHNQTVVSWLRISFGLLIAAAFIAQLHFGIQQGRSTANFFSFFTIQSNLIAGIVLLAVGIGSLVGRKATPQFALLRGAATLYIAITGVVFALLLSGLSQRLQLTLPWVDMVLHQLIPTVVLLDWVLFPPKTKIHFRQTFVWLIYPLAYVAYTLIRGPIVNWYPYPFLDPPEVGWATVIGTSIFIAIGAAGLSWLLALRTGRKL